jgi:DNA-binding GntR family transcriptional regulator
MIKELISSIHIDRRSAIPVYEQIRNDIQSLIASKKLTHESILPPIDEFVKLLEVPINDVLTAFDLLTGLRYIIPIDNGCYRVTFYDLHSDLHKPFYVIIDQIVAMGMSVSIVLLERKVIFPTVEESILYGFPTSERLLYLKRLYCGDQRPFFMGEHVIPLSIFPMFEEIIKGNERLYPLMIQYGKVEMNYVNRLAEARVMSPALANTFSSKPGSPYLEVSSKMYDQYQRQIEFSSISLIANYSIELTLSRQQLFD